MTQDEIRARLKAAQAARRAHKAREGTTHAKRVAPRGDGKAQAAAPPEPNVKASARNASGDMTGDMDALRAALASGAVHVARTYRGADGFVSTWYAYADGTPAGCSVTAPEGVAPNRENDV